MGNWTGGKIKIKHLFTENDDHEAVQTSMKNVADELKKDPRERFVEFDMKKFYKIPEGDDVINPTDYANKLLNKLYDFADERRIWIE